MILIPLRLAEIRIFVSFLLQTILDNRPSLLAINRNMSGRELVPELVS